MIFFSTGACFMCARFFCFSSTFFLVLCLVSNVFWLVLFLEWCSWEGRRKVSYHVTSNSWIQVSQTHYLFWKIKFQLPSAPNLISYRSLFYSVSDAWCKLHYWQVLTHTWAIWFWSILMPIQYWWHFVSCSSRRSMTDKLLKRGMALLRKTTWSTVTRVQVSCSQFINELL